MRTTLCRVLFSAALCGVSLSAFASLGGTPSTVDGDAVRLSAAHAQTPSGALVAHVLSLASGTVVREYTSNNLVVAVTWSGPTEPNLSQLFGEQYFARLEQAQQQRTGGINHHFFVLHASDLVIESQGGPHRLYSGRAWLPNALPAGVTPEQFQ